MSTVFKYQDNDLCKIKLTNLDSITVNMNRLLDNELANKKYVVDSIREATFF